MRVLPYAVFACAASVLLAAPARDVDPARAQAVLSALPLRFEANAGQWDPAVRFSARSAGYTLQLTGAGASLAFSPSSRVDLVLLNSNPAAAIEGLDRTATSTGYFLGSRARWRTDVPSYSRVRYRAAYPGIDVVYYGKQQELEFDFVVQPGADPSAVRMRFNGAGAVSVGPDGDLLVQAADGRLVQKKPFVYQLDARGSKRRVDGSYALAADGTVSFRLGRYDRKRELVIDPLLTFSSYLGAELEDQVTAVKVDSRGRMYVTGSTVSLFWTAPENAFRRNPNGTKDVFIAVLDATESGNFGLLYFSYIGGTAGDVPAGMQINAAGHMFVAGTTLSKDFPMAGVNVQSQAKGDAENVFVFEFDPSASGSDALWYSTYFGGTLADYARGVAVDGRNAIYVIGTTASDDLPVTDSAYAKVRYGKQDAFLAKIDPAAPTPLIYSSYMGGELLDEGRDIAVSPNGIVYFAATTDSKEFPLATAPYRMTLMGQEDIILGVMDMNRSGESSLLYSTYFGGSDLDQVRKIGFDGRGRLLVTGYTFSNDFPITFDAVQSEQGGNGDVFVSVVDPSEPGAFVVYSTFLGGSMSEVAYDVLGDSSGSIYVTGYTLSNNFPITSDAFQSAYQGGIEVFITKLKPGEIGRSGLQFSSGIGGEGVHVPTSLAVGPDGTLYIAGYTNLGLPAVGSAARLYGGGTTDGFIMAITQLAGQPIRTSDRKAMPRAPRF